MLCLVVLSHETRGSHTTMTMATMLLALAAAQVAASAEEPIEPGSFFREVAKALTCEGLEFEAMQQSSCSQGPGSYEAFGM